MTALRPELAATLDRVAEATAGLPGPWWVFGGAAMALYGLTDEPVPDVDVLAELSDVRRLGEALGGGAVTYPEDDADRFRSDLLVRCTTTPLPVEAMAGLRVRTTEGWRPVAFASRSPVDWKGGTLFVPEPREHAAVCRLFGRPKDLRRAALLDAIGAPA